MTQVQNVRLSAAFAVVALLLAACAPAAPPAATSVPPTAPAAKPTSPPAPAAAPTAATKSATAASPAASPVGSPAAKPAASPAAAASPVAKPAAAPSYPTISIAAKPDVVRIGFQAIPNSERIAKQMQTHEKTLGTRIEWREFDSGRDVNTAMASNSLDIALVGSSPAAAGIAQGLPYEVIALYDVIGDNEALAVRGNISSFNDLKGKKVAVPFGSTTHYHLLKALELNNIKPSELTIIDMAPKDMLAAWTRGDIDAGFVWHPVLQELYDSGGKPLIKSGELAARGFLTADVAVARTDFSQKYPDLVAAYVQDLSKAVDLYRQNPNEAAAIMAREMGVPQDKILPQMRDLIWLNSADQIDAKYFGTTGSPGALGQALKLTADFLVDQKVIRQAPELAVFQKAANPAYLQKSVGR